MRGVHDLGGTRGFGPVRIDEKLRFGEDWERRVFGLNMGTLGVGLYNVDQNRYARERMEPAAYLTASYYEQLLAAVETCLVEADIVSVAEIDGRASEILHGGERDFNRNVPPEVEAAVMERLSAGISRQRDELRPPRFAVGDAVTAGRRNTAGHTRLPTYVQGCHGEVTRVRPTYVLPDTSAHGQGEQPEPVYAVAFAATELWGDEADPRCSVSVELWERYLERDPDRTRPRSGDPVTGGGREYEER